MPTLVIDNVPELLFDRIQLLAKIKQQTAADAALQVLATALVQVNPLSEAPLPQPPFLTEEISAPIDIPWPEGEVVTATEIRDYLPTPHDIPDEE